MINYDGGELVDCLFTVKRMYERNISENERRNTESNECGKRR